MADVRLHQNVPNNALSNSAFLLGAQVRGTRFRVTQTGFVKDVAWWQTNDANVKPAALAIWNENGTILWQTDQVPEDVGLLPAWQRVDVTETVQLLTGVTYTVGGHQPTGSNCPEGSVGLRGSPPAAFQYDDFGAHYTTSAYPAYPNTGTNDFFGGYDLTLSDVDPGGGGTGGGGSASLDLADWFDPTVATKPAEDPKLYPRVIQSLDGWQTFLHDALVGFSETMGATAQDQLDALRIVLENRFDLVDSIQQAIEERLGDTEGTSIVARLVALLTGQAALSEAVDNLPTGLTLELDVLREQLTLSPDVAEPGRWTLVNTTNGVGNGFVADQADMYRLSFTAIPPLMPQHDLPGGVLWLPRAGWCAPVRDGYVGPRKFLDFANNDVRWEGYLMHGLIVYLPPALEWQCGAYVLDRG